MSDLQRRVSLEGGLLLEVVSRKQVICDDSLLLYTASSKNAPDTKKDEPTGVNGLNSDDDELIEVPVD